ncbi:hypothetical protein DLAC_11598 [Tieghemostelium lacteum]|uniref:Uncharacterized protein n=1 Tax=Tieghemostelium lacteum TaxID=361077 RepID=A0A151ZK62_TIELA|nr:hypothetical protein DLAC_11598 [Tieghemostelium lacteum]|eukprot:KYQ94388.1 hypothetical protein DLAC_11598 [Tieghemostelium lacteum]
MNNNIFYLSNNNNNEKSFKDIQIVLSDFKNVLSHLVVSNASTLENGFIIQLGSNPIDKQSIIDIFHNSSLKNQLEDNLKNLVSNSGSNIPNDYYFTETVIKDNTNYIDLYIITLYNSLSKEFKYFLNFENINVLVSTQVFIRTSKYKTLLEMADFLRPNKYSGLFEIHITVQNGNQQEQEKFTTFCNTHKLKSILIELPDMTVKEGKEVYTYQMMTSSHHHSSDLVSIQLRAYDLANKLVSEGFRIQRIKIETLVSCKGVPSTVEEQQCQSPLNYFEFHIKLLLPMTADLQVLSNLVKPFQGHLSRNSFKKFIDNHTQIRFVTLRIYNTYKEQALLKFEEVKSILSNNQYHIDSAHKEYSLYDSNVGLDNSWLLTNL